MILSEDMSRRYLRHIIIPEIGESGQKQILESAVLVVGETSDEAEPLLLYLAASGIGRLTLRFLQNDRIHDITTHLKDLNPDISIKILNSDDEIINSSSACRIVFGKKDFIEQTINRIQCQLSQSSPTIVALYDSWQGKIGQVDSNTAFDTAINDNLSISDPELLQIGEVFSFCLLGALGAIETIKCILNLGSPLQKPLYVNLLNMSFGDFGTEPDVSLNDNININFEKKLKDARVLIVGTGGLGSPASYALTKAGLGTLGLLDSDVIETSNLNRQVLHSTSRIGMPKVKSAEYFLKQLNTKVNIIPYETHLSKKNAEIILKDFDMVISAVDNLETRYLLNDTCFFLEKPLAEAGIMKFDGLGMTIVPKVGHCYRCIFPEAYQSTGSPIGILGPVPGVMGTIEAAETVKLLMGIGNKLINRVLIFDGLHAEFRLAKVLKNSECPLCGNSPSITKP